MAVQPMSATAEYDSIIIGAGQSGPSLAERLAKSGHRTALVEKRALGGTCVNDGCMPTKTLVASARAAWVARNAARWGVVLGGEVRVDMKAVKARKDAVVEETRRGLDKWVDDTANLDLIRGNARFVDPHTVEVNGQRLRGARFFLNLGARPVVPPIPGLADGPYFTNENIMDVDTLPAHLVILGGSYVGLEFAQMYRRFGSEVTIIQRGDRLIPREDPEVSAAILDLLVGEGVRVLLSAEATTVIHRAGGLSVKVRAGAEDIAVDGSHVLVAVGRAPATGGIGLAEAGIETDKRGYIVTDDRLLTTQPHVWALGDANGRGAFTHTSFDDFQIVAANLFDGADRRVTERIPIYGLYIDPPLGRCGKTIAEARAEGRPLLIGKRLMTRVGRARERAETAGFIQIVVDAGSRRIVGAAILGIEGDEAMHCIVDVMYAGAPCDVLQRAVHAHPTVSELIPTVLSELRPLEPA